MNRERTKRKLKLLNTKKPVKEKTPPEIVFDGVLTVGAHKPMRNNLKRRSGQYNKTPPNYTKLHPIKKGGNASRNDQTENRPGIYTTRAVIEWGQQVTVIKIIAVIKR